MSLRARWRCLIAAGACASGVALAMSGTAAGATAQVQAGDFGPQAAAMNTFYPKQAVVRRGDRVRFSIVGFHTVAFPKRGGSVPPLIVPDGPNPVTNDPAGLPYWWSATTPQLMFNPKAAAPSGGTSVTGAKLVNSGAPQGNRPSFTVSFPKAGTFQVRCAVHPNMIGSVKVLPPDATPLSAARQARRAARQKAKDRRDARDFVREAPGEAGANEVLIGPGSHRVAILGFFPKLRTVPAGSDVTFRMDGRNEVHTVSFGPGPFLQQVARASFQGSGLAVESQGSYPTDPPALGPPAVTATAHGNGFVSSGILTDPGVPPGPRRFTFRFSTPGVYQYICLIHPEMRGRIAVTP